MSFLNFIKDNFNRVLSVDTEFRMDETKTIPKKVVCCCYEDVFTGERWEFWEHDKPNNKLKDISSECEAIKRHAEKIKEKIS